MQLTSDSVQLPFELHMIDISRMPLTKRRPLWSVHLHFTTVFTGTRDKSISHSAPFILRNGLHILPRGTEQLKALKFELTIIETLKKSNFTLRNASSLPRISGLTRQRSCRRSIWEFVLPVNTKSSIVTIFWVLWEKMRSWQIESICVAK